MKKNLNDNLTSIEIWDDNFGWEQYKCPEGYTMKEYIEKQAVCWEENSIPHDFIRLNGWYAFFGKKKNNLYKDAIAKFGQVMQITMFFEEASELIKALTKELRGKGNRDNIAEEMADVEIMLEQLKTIFNNNDLIEKFKIEKLERLEKILKKEKVKK